MEDSNFAAILSGIAAVALLIAAFFAKKTINQENLSDRDIEAMSAAKERQARKLANQAKGMKSTHQRSKK